MKRRNYVLKCNRCQRIPEYSNDLDWVSGVKGSFCPECKQVVTTRLEQVQPLLISDEMWASYEEKVK